MIKEAVKNWEDRKFFLQEKFEANHPENYLEIVKNIIQVISDEDNKWDSFAPDPEKIHEINDGGYEGTLVYVIGEKGYQPDNYWYVKVSYGSCSGCDTLEGIRMYGDGKPTKEQVDKYMTLSLHIIQGLKKMGDDLVDVCF